MRIAEVAKTHLDMDKRDFKEILSKIRYATDICNDECEKVSFKEKRNVKGYYAVIVSGFGANGSTLWELPYYRRIAP